MEEKTTIRDRLKSNYTRHLEEELARVRADKDARIRELIAEKIELNKKVSQLEMALIPALRFGHFQNPDRPGFPIKSSTLEVPAEASSFQQALEEHNRAEEEREKLWRQKNNGPAAAGK